MKKVKGDESSRRRDWKVSGYLWILQSEEGRAYDCEVGKERESLNSLATCLRFRRLVLAFPSLSSLWFPFLFQSRPAPAYFESPLLHSVEGKLPVVVETDWKQRWNWHWGWCWCSMGLMTSDLKYCLRRHFPSLDRSLEVIHPHHLRRHSQAEVANHHQNERELFLFFHLEIRFESS